MDDDKQPNKNSTSIHSKPGEKTLLQNQGGLTGSHRKQISASNVKNAVNFIKSQIYQAKGGTVTNASEMGHSTKPTTRAIKHTQRFDTPEEAEQFAKENGLDPNQITEATNIYGKPIGYRIDWKETKVSDPVSELSTKDAPDDQAGNARSRYLHGDQATAQKYMNSQFPEDKIRQFTKAMMQKLIDKGYDMRSDYFNNGDFYLDAFENLLRYNMNPDEALKHLNEEYKEHKVDAQGNSLDNNDIHPQGINFRRANNISKPGVNDTRLAKNPDDLSVKMTDAPNDKAIASNTLDKGQGVADNSMMNDDTGEVEGEFSDDAQHTANPSTVKGKEETPDNDDLEFTTEDDEDKTPEDDLLDKLFGGDDDDNNK